MNQAQTVNKAAGRAAGGESEHLDVIVIGAGLSGIGAACYLKTRCPSKRFVLLESRNEIGGTWDLFRYPGIRSDSDMYTLGFSFRPWGNDKSIAEGPAILQYIKDTAREYQVEQNIRFGHYVKCARWDSGTGRWTLEVEVGGGESLRYSCNFLYMCSGYYDYKQGYLPQWQGLEKYGGLLVHPQHWPEGLDYAGRRVVVIGSGATAVTLVPEMAKRAAHVTMLQRSPTYIISRSARDGTAIFLRRWLPAKLAHNLVRWKNVLLTLYFYKAAKKLPGFVSRHLIAAARKHLGPDYDVEKHFTPSYGPWDQRLCLAPDADFFTAIRAGRASVVTDRIAAFTESGLQLASGEQLDADIIVTATGLKVQLMGGMQLFVDGTAVDLSEKLSYKGIMYSDIPNMASAWGYTNASWTLKCELISQYVCRLLNYMQARGYTTCTPRRGDHAGSTTTTFDLTSGYLQRANDILPKQGTGNPWITYQNYLSDLRLIRFGSLEDKTMEFT